MVGPGDIPCVGKFVERVSEYTVEAVFRGLKYMFCYKALVDDLNSEIGKLNTEKGKMARKVEEEQKNGKIIEEYVLDWQKDVEEIQKSGEELSPSCSCIQRLPIPNPISRFQIGRNAAKKAKTVAELTISGNKHLTGEIAHLPPVINMPKSDTSFEEFLSRKDAYKKLWDALVTDDSPLIHGIYGMAGVGKTRMTEQIWEDAMKNKIFDKVVRVNVGSEELDEINLQDQIASRLDCHLDSQYLDSQLENSLRNGGKVLLILDDVWREIPSDDIIGTPFGHGSSSMGSKILLTSREREVCLNNKCEHLVEIRTLSPDEALELFKKAVGPDTINSLPDESLVKKVCDECGQLPLLIHAVGKALQRKRHNTWADAYNQLKKGNIGKIAGQDPYACIKLSIDNLIDDDAKLCLFFCCMFPEDAMINMKILIQLATGSRLISGGESRILAMVDYLKTSSLLLDSGKDYEIKVHDIIRDVARSMAYTESRYAFLHVKCNSGYFPFNASYRTRKFLRLDMETDDFHFDEHLECPDLHTLWLQSNDHPQEFSGGFFTMFANLSCLMLQNVNIELKQFSLHPLHNLGTLSLLKCDIRKTDARLFPKSLESLCIYKCKLPEMPLDVANLKCLRKLEIQGRDPVSVMENVISSLSSLEELHISDGFIHDICEYHLEPIVTEISKLTRLTSLLFEFYKDGFEFYEDEDNTSQGTDIFSNIKRYNIFVGYRTLDDRLNGSIDFQRDWKVPLTKSIEFTGNHSKPWEGLMARAEVVELRESDVEVSSICSGHRGAFEDLKKLYIYHCDNMGHLASILQDEIQYSVQSAPCFSKLTNLEIIGCSKLKYLFCNNIAKSLVQLQQLTVEYCKSMKAIVMNEGASDGGIINFSKLKSLKIQCMKRLKKFHAENSGYPSAQYQPFLDGMVTFPCLEFISIRGCRSMRSMFPPSVASDLRQLKQMIVKECKEMIGITGVDEQAISDGILFPELTFLELVNLPSLTSFWCYQSGKASTCKVPLRLPRLSSIVVIDLPDLKSFFDDENFEFHMPALKKVIVNTCRFSTLFTFSMFRKFQLETLSVRNCEFLVNIVEDARGDEICNQIITLSELTKVDLANLPNLKGFFHNANYEFHMSTLKEVYVNSCSLSSLFTLSKFRKLQLEKLEVSDCELMENIVEDLRGDETCDQIITLTQLTKVVLIELPNLRRFFNNANYEFHMPVLKTVIIRDCGLSNTLFTRSIFKNLQQLEELSVSCCKLLEGIFEDATGNESLDTSDKIITLNRVSEVCLEGLPKFRCIFYGETYECHMPALRDVTIAGCELPILFTCSVFRGIQQLKTLHITHCESLEHIVEEVGGDEISKMNGKSITFNQLSSITLEFLPNLKSFGCTSSYVFNMPKLQNFRLIECPQIEYFSSSKANTSLGFQDLDKFIRQNHKGGSYPSDIDGESSHSFPDIIELQETPKEPPSPPPTEPPTETESETDSSV